ncbi:MAG: hypothetical protein PHI98_10830 [Eubacteriales bacterium]|nr:hypothetical protein [Eubacteriales bacterium]
MAFLNPETGTLVFEDGFCLRPGMPAKDLNRHCLTLSDAETTFCLDAHPLPGGSLAPVCVVDGDGLMGVTLHVVQTGSKERPGAERQRAFLFSTFHMKDPCPDTHRCVRVRCPFGSLTICSDPYTGCAMAQLSYSREEKQAL